MQGLSAYQAGIRDALRELEPLVTKYGAEDSPLGREDAAQLTQTFQKAREHCNERLGTDLPKVMLYGVYNAGKSTLLNALLGEEAASVADKPETCKLTSYLWNGYELLDTPGIDAPIEHERISREALTRCQVILFVISAARSFENLAIFEAMRDVAQQGKRLLIILNNKEHTGNTGRDNPDMLAVKQAIQRNLMAVGFSAEQAAAFRLCVVNARFALLGRLHKDDRLVESSGILELERLAVEEIRRVNGFAIAIDLYRYLEEAFTPFVEQLARLDTGETGIRRNEFLNACEEYADFCADLESKVKEECAPLERSFMNCFPAVASLTESSGVMDNNAINDRISKVWEEYGESVKQLVQSEIKRYSHRLAAQLRPILTALPDMASMAEAAPNGETLNSIGETLGHRPRPVAPAVPSVSESSLCGKVEAAGSLLSGTALAGAILKIPLPVLGPLPVPIGLVLTIGPRILRALFGKSKAELENERIEAEAAAQRRAEEEQARRIALWRQELQHHCQELARQFLVVARKNLSVALDATFAEMLADTEAEMRQREATGQDILQDSLRLQGILKRLASVRDSFHSRQA